jgi:peptide deformylase
MSLRPILKYPEPILKRKAQPVPDIDGQVQQLINDMVDTMYAAPGVGLAAPQVGDGHRIIVLDVDTENPRKHLIKLINPVIAEAEGQIIWEEGCLSVFDYKADVKRAARVLVKGWTLDQKEIEIEAEELLAVALQHEIDHLEGKLFIDRISRLKRDLYKRKIQKMIREGIPLESKQSDGDRGI